MKCDVCGKDVDKPEIVFIRELPATVGTRLEVCEDCFKKLMELSRK